jgi:hypothetical protein
MREVNICCPRKPRRMVLDLFCISVRKRARPCGQMALAQSQSRAQLAPEFPEARHSI